MFNRLPLSSRSLPAAWTPRCEAGELQGATGAYQTRLQVRPVSRCQAWHTAQGSCAGCYKNTHLSSLVFLARHPAHEVYGLEGIRPLDHVL